MVKVAIIFLAVVVIWLGLSVALPTPDEERFLDKEVIF